MREDILTSLTGLACMFNVQLNKAAIDIWMRVLADLSPAEFQVALDKYLFDPQTGKYFPKPWQIYSIARPKRNEEDEAVLIVDNMLYSQRHYGPDSIGEKRAMQKIGPIGWVYIQNTGGWAAFVNSILSEDDVPIVRAQLRRSITATLRSKQIDETNKITNEKPMSLESLGVKLPNF